jgi:hypothetical protein
MNTNLSIIKPLRPSGSGWIGPIELPPRVMLGFEGYLWQHLQLAVSVISALEVSKDADGIDRGPEYHVSIAALGPVGPARCPKELAQLVLRTFGGLDGWEEDNHVPGGVVRNFWRPVADPMIGLECACKDTEAVVVEGDYEYRPLEGA